MPQTDLSTIWVYLSASPLAGLTITLMAYGIAQRLYQKFDNHPLLHPVVIAAAMLITFLLLSGTPYQAYFKGGQYVHFLLGPATVALAIPLYQQLPKIKKMWLPISITLVGGVCMAALSSVMIAQFLGASIETQLSLAPKSVTAPVAMAISEQIGGLPSLTAVLVVCTGILGAIVGTRILDALHIKDDSIKGIAMGITAHGIGTARAFQVSSEMGAFSGLAMALATFTTAFILPWLVGYLI
jgi:predicted murein hydrolase (TIGR00659 family)